MDEKEAAVQELGRALNELITDIYGKQMGFALIIFEFYKPGIGDFISNAEREDMIKALRECAERLEKKQFIPSTIGSG